MTPINISHVRVRAIVTVLPDRTLKFD